MRLILALVAALLLCLPSTTVAEEEGQQLGGCYYVLAHYGAAGRYHVAWWILYYEGYWENGVYIPELWIVGP